MTTALFSSLDEPAEGRILRRERIAMGGWVAHLRRQVLGVLVSVNGEFRGAGSVDVPRPDVRELYPEAAGAATAGWSVDVDLRSVTGDQVELAVHALLGPKPGKGHPDRRQAVLLVSRVYALTDVREGRFLETEELSAGPAMIQGLAEAPGGVSTVEVFCDGRSVGLARTGLPGRLDDLDQGPESAIAMFQLSMVVPDDRERLRFTARVTPCIGTSFDLAPWTVAVRPSSPGETSHGRLELVRARTQALIEDPSTGGAAAAAGPLRVLVLAHDLGLGGAQFYLQELLKRMAARGVECFVVSPRGGRLLDELEDLGFPVLVTGSHDVHQAEAHEAQVRLIMQFAASHGCEAALANAMTTYAGVDAAQRLGLGVVWALHESLPVEEFWGGFYAPPVPAYAAERARGALAATCRAVFEAGATRDLYTPHLGENVGVVVRYGVDFSEIDEYRARVDRARLRDELGIAPATTALLVVGTVEPRKAQVNILQAFAGSTALGDQDVLLVFVGAQPGSPYTEHLEDLVERYGETRVRIEPIQPDTGRWYHSCDVLVCGSDVESMPRTMLEAMAFERPVASTAVFGIPDLVEDGVNGFLCCSRDQLALRAMLERVAGTSRDELAGMGARARRKVLEHHDPEIYARYFFDELHAVAGRAPKDGD